MADLSSMAAIKGRQRTPSLRGLESMHIPTLPRLQCIRNTEPRNKLYDIIIVQELEDKVKVHYVGYPDRFDEWMPTCDIVHKPSTPDDEELPPSYHLACSIKQKLLPRKLDDPAVRIYMPYPTEAFQELSRRVKSMGVVRGCDTTVLMAMQRLLIFSGSSGKYAWLISTVTPT